jgi:hypothetical protein
MEQVSCNGFQQCKRGLRGLLRNPAAALRLVFLFGLVLPPAFPAADESLEYQVKAAFLLNFTKFVEWPQSAFEAADSPIAICILGDDPFGAALDRTVAGEVVGGRKLTIQRLKRAPAPKACQELFIRTDKEISRIPSGLGPGVLTVGEGESFLRDGGMIAFVIESRRVRFSINLSAAENAGLKLSSRLLSVAKSIEK